MTDSEALRAMARRVAEQRQEKNDILACHGEAFQDLYGRINDLEHERHGRWRRWKATNRVLSWAYGMGLVSGHGNVFTSACNGCVTRISWRGKRPYFLGMLREEWGCLLRGRHRSRFLPGTYLCAVCAPCPECQSPDPLHDSWACEIEADERRTASRVGASQ